MQALGRLLRTATLKSDLPITSLVSVAYRIRTFRAAGISYDGMDLYEYEHRALQAKIAALSKNTEHSVARYSTHLYKDTDPWIVIEEINLLIKRLPKKRDLPLMLS